MIFRRKLLLAAAVLSGLIICLVGPAAAIMSWDAAADFSPTSNPTGPWGYGWSTTLTSTVNPYIINFTEPVSGFQFWNINSGLNDYVPGVWKNPSASSVSWGTLIVPGSALAFHPGYYDQYSHVVWTAAAAGNYAVNATFTGIDNYFGGTDVHIYANGSSQYSGNVANGYGQYVSESFSVYVPVNGTIDFAVGYGSDGNYSYDSTQLAATITAIPLPPTALLLGSGMLGLGLLRFRRKT